MLRLFEAHREAEAARDIDAILETFVHDCFLETVAFGEDVAVVWGMLRGTSRGEWLGVAPGGGAFVVPFTNIVPFRDGLMEGERIYFDLATLCEQARIPLQEVRTAAAQLASAGAASH